MPDNDLNFKVTLTRELIEAGIKKSVEDALGSPYSSNPIRQAVEEVLQEQKEPIKKLVIEMITSVITDDLYKDKLKDVVLQKLVGQIIK